MVLADVEFKERKCKILFRVSNESLSQEKNIQGEHGPLAPVAGVAHDEILLYFRIV